MDLHDKLRRLIGKRVRIKARPRYSSVHARTFAGQSGMLYGTYRDPEDGQVLGAVVGKHNITWVDGRDLEEVTG